MACNGTTWHGMIHPFRLRVRLMRCTHIPAQRTVPFEAVNARSCTTVRDQHVAHPMPRHVAGAYNTTRYQRHALGLACLRLRFSCLMRIRYRIFCWPFECVDSCAPTRPAVRARLCYDARGALAAAHFTNALLRRPRMRCHRQRGLQVRGASINACAGACRAPARSSPSARGSAHSLRQAPWQTYAQRTQPALRIAGLAYRDRASLLLAGAPAHSRASAYCDSPMSSDNCEDSILIMIISTARSLSSAAA